MGTDKLWVSPGKAYLSPVCIHGGVLGFFAEMLEGSLAALWFCPVSKMSCIGSIRYYFEVVACV